MALFFKKKRELHPLEALSQGYLQCSDCDQMLPLQQYEPLVAGKCDGCGSINFVPMRVGKFWLFYPLGGGGMGAVYKAYWEEKPDDFFAVKILPRQQTENPRLIEALEEEAAIIGALGQHPCIVSSVGAGFVDNEHYLATTFVDGERFDKRIERLGKVPEMDVLYIALRLIAAEAHIYNRGFLFRDLKPENIIITEADGAFLFDYGICMAVKTALEDPGDIVQGSVLYFPPERLGGEGEQVSSEIYCLGMVLYHALTGKPFFSANEIRGVARMHMREARLSSLEGKLKKVKPDIAVIIDRMTKRAPEDRYQNFAEAERDIFNVIRTRMAGGDA
jgi:serine/threonine-protein kinase